MLEPLATCVPHCFPTAFFKVLREKKCRYLSVKHCGQYSWNSLQPASRAADFICCSFISAPVTSLSKAVTALNLSLPGPALLQQPAHPVPDRLLEPSAASTGQQVPLRRRGCTHRAVVTVNTCKTSISGETYPHLGYFKAVISLIYVLKSAWGENSDFFFFFLILHSYNPSGSEALLGQF